MFYCNLAVRHFYADGFNNEVIDKHPIGWNETCDALRYLDLNKPIEAGMDAGNMLSMVFGQQSGHTYRILKEWCSCACRWIPHLLCSSPSKNTQTVL